MTEQVPVKHGRVMGPVDYVMVRFPGNKFTGKIAPELLNLEKKGIIRVIDLVFIMRDENGKLLINEVQNLKGEAAAAFSVFAKNTSEWFTQDDIEAIAATLPNNSSAGLLLFENVWAIHFKEAALEAGVELIDMGRIPPEAIMKAEKALIVKGGI